MEAATSTSVPSWSRDARAADTRLHGLIAASCGSRRLTAEIDRYATLWRTLRDVSQRLDVVSNQKHMAAMLWPDHLEIVRALRAVDAEAAARLMSATSGRPAGSLEEVMFGEWEVSDAAADRRDGRGPEPARSSFKQVPGGEAEMASRSMATAPPQPRGGD